MWNPALGLPSKFALHTSTMITCTCRRVSNNNYYSELNKILSLLLYSDLGVTSAGPPSASLLQDWLGLGVGLNPEDMDAMEKELETGAPDIFFNDL